MTGRRPFRPALALCAAALVLSACGGNRGFTMRPYEPAPITQAELRVRTFLPLTIPPVLSLPAPAPGAANRADP